MPKASTFTVGGIAKGAGMLAPGLATMLVVLTTDAQVPAEELDVVLRDATRVTFDRADSDGCMSTNDTVVLLASGASEAMPSAEQLGAGVTAGVRGTGPQADRRRRRRQPRHRHPHVQRGERARRRNRQPFRGPLQPLQDRHLRQGPELGPRPVRGGHHGRRLRSRTSSTSP